MKTIQLSSAPVTRGFTSGLECNNLIRSQWLLCLSLLLSALNEGHAFFILSLQQLMACSVGFSVS